MSKMPWVRFFPSDWLAGSRGLSAAETGVYISLVAMMYERGAPLTEDDAWLARLCGASNSLFKKALQSLLQKGKITRSDGGLWNCRVARELENSSKKSEVGRNAAGKRWGKDKENQSSVDAIALPKQSGRNANHNHNHNHKTEAKASKARRRAEVDPSFNDFLDAFPRREGIGNAENAYRAALKIATSEVIIEGATRYAARRQGEDPKFTRLPATWLNGKGWLDEKPPASAINGRPRDLREIKDPVDRARFQSF